MTTMSNYCDGFERSSEDIMGSEHCFQCANLSIVDNIPYCIKRKKDNDPYK